MTRREQNVERKWMLNNIVALRCASFDKRSLPDTMTSFFESSFTCVITFGNLFYFIKEEWNIWVKSNVMLIFFKFSPSDGSKLDLTCLFKLKIFWAFQIILSMLQGSTTLASPRGKICRKSNLSSRRVSNSSSISSCSSSSLWNWKNYSNLLIFTSFFQFHTDPLSSTQRFNTRTTLFQHPKSLSLTLKTPQFNTRIFCVKLMCWTEEGVELRGTLS